MFNRHLQFLLALLFLVYAGCQFRNGKASTQESLPFGESPNADSPESDGRVNYEEQTQANKVGSGVRKDVASMANQQKTMPDSSHSPPKSKNSKSSVSGSNTSKIKQKQSLAEKFLFQPLKYPHGFDRATVEGQRITFSSEDRIELDGQFFSAADAKGVIVYCHGNAGNLASRTGRMESLKNQSGYSVFLFDYRGYGRSEGTPTVSGVVADARAAVRKAAELGKVRAQDVILMGRSLGGAVAVQVATEFQAPKLIVESSFTSFRNVARDHVSIFSGFTRKNDLNSLKAIGDYRGSVLISHGTSDRVVPFKHGKQLYEAANHPKQFFEIKNGGHNDPLPESYREILATFLSQSQ